MAEKIYTKTGDAGDTGLFGGGRVSKASARVEAYGAVDELNAQIGMARALDLDAGLDALLAETQSDLFTIGAHLATTGGKAASHLPPLPAARVDAFEAWIDLADGVLPELKAFVLPGGTPAAAALHVCRTVCRRAERRVVALAAAEPVDALVIVFLNRLSDLLFEAARHANHIAGVPDIPWRTRS